MKSYDVAVIGGGVVGCAIAMELSRLRCSVALVEARSDVCGATSKANSAILHTGFDAPPGSLESQLLTRSYHLFHERAGSLGIPIDRCGGMVVAWSEEQQALLPAIVAKAAKNGRTDLERLDAEEIYRREPRLGPGALAAVRVHGESLICPFTPALAFATTAVRNGVDLVRGFPVASARRAGGSWTLGGPAGSLEAGLVINAAGLHSDEVERLFGKSTFTVRPRKGEFIVFDKPAGRLIGHIILPVPTARTKGVLLARTAFGNLLLGPTAIDIDDKDDVSVSAASLQALLAAGLRILPALSDEDVTCTYAGLRAATEHQDYQIHFYPEDAYITVGGIRSTGLSASLGIAEHIVGKAVESFGLGGGERPDWTPHRAPPITEFAPRACQDEALVRADPDYGRIVCHCERATRGEILAALRSPVPALDLEGVKRRTRATMGRCQGFNCHAPITAMLRDHAKN
jgi:glycerol-3-phosphate dehydrogenase